MAPAACFTLVLALSFSSPLQVKLIAPARKAALSATLLIRPIRHHLLDDQPVESAQGFEQALPHP